MEDREIQFQTMKKAAPFFKPEGKGYSQSWTHRNFIKKYFSAIFFGQGI